jgi:hypothetical protein
MVKVHCPHAYFIKGADMNENIAFIVKPEKTEEFFRIMSQKTDPKFFEECKRASEEIKRLSM